MRSNIALTSIGPVFVPICRSIVGRRRPHVTILGADTRLLGMLPCRGQRMFRPHHVIVVESLAGTPQDLRG